MKPHGIRVADKVSHLLLSFFPFEGYTEAVRQATGVCEQVGMRSDLRFRLLWQRDKGWIRGVLSLGEQM